MIWWNIGFITENDFQSNDQVMWMLVIILLSSCKDLETLTGVYAATQDLKRKQNFECKT